MYIIKKNLISLKRDNKQSNTNKGKNYFYLDRNENPIKYNKKTISKLVSIFTRIDLSRYPNINNFKKKLSNFVGVNQENLFITEGVSGAIKSLMEVYTVPKKTNIIFPSPTFALYPIFAKMFDVKVIKILYKNYKLNFNSLLKSINKKTSLVFLPNPNNPIEGHLSLNQIKKILRTCKKNKCFLVLDEVYYPFGKTTGVKLLKDYNNLFIMRSFSKAGGLAGIRLGYLIGSKKNINYVSKIRGGYESNTLSLEIASFFIDNYKIIKNQIKRIKEGFFYLKKNLKKEKIDFIGGTHGNYIFIDFKNKKKASFIVNFLKNNKIIVRSNWTKPFDRGFSFAGLDLINMKIFYKNFVKGLKEFKKYERI